MRVAIEGNLGSRVNEFLERLEKDGYIVYYEPPLTDSLCIKYTDNKDRYALAYHLLVLNNYLDGPNGDDELYIYERSPYTHKAIYEANDANQSRLDPDEHKLYQSYADNYGWKPDVIIYLYCDPRVCHERLKTSTMTLDEITQLHLEHEIAMDDHNCSTPIYKINDHEDEETIYRNLREILYQLQLGKCDI